MQRKSICIFALALIQVAWAQQELNATQTTNVIPTDEDDGYTPLEDLLDAVNAQSIDDKGYFRSDGYKAKSAADKLVDLWQMIMPDETVVEEPADFMWKEFDNFFGQRPAGSFCDQSDEIRKKRPKTTHTQGVVAKVQWKVVNPAFSGMYEHGSEHAILRLSETRNLTEESDGLLPSMALKFLIDGIKSENLFAMPNMDGIYEDGPSWDFFHAPLKSRVARFTDDCKRDSMEKIMIEGNNRPYATSVIRPAAVTTDGTVVDTEKRTAFRVPYQLEYEGVYNFDDPSDDAIWYDQLKNHFNPQFETSGDEGVTIMKVYGWDQPEALHTDDKPSNRIHIADIVLKTPLFTSKNGDERLFFQHQRVNLDRRHWPRAWKVLAEDFEAPRVDADFPGIETWPQTDEEARAQFVNSVAKDENGVRGCPFTWLWNDPLV